MRTATMYRGTEEVKEARACHRVASQARSFKYSNLLLLNSPYTGKDAVLNKGPGVNFNLSCIPLRCYGATSQPLHISRSRNGSYPRRRCTSECVYLESCHTEMMGDTSELCYHNPEGEQHTFIDKSPSRRLGRHSSHIVAVAVAVT